MSVVGEVNNPGRKPLRGRTRLFDVLIEAGGFTPRASGEVVITRREGTFDNGGHSLRLQFSGASPAPKDLVNLEVPLQNGDLITASAKYYVTVEGEVVRPGRYPLEEETTISTAVIAAGGLTRFAKNDVKVRRVNPETGKTEILEVDLRERGQASRRGLGASLEAHLDGLGIHRLPVVELHPLAQLDGDRLAVLGGFMRERQLRHDVELVVDVEQLVAQRREHDAPDVGARQRGVEHIRVLRQADAQGRLRHRGGPAQQECCGYSDETKPWHETALPSWPLLVLHLRIERPE